MSACSLPLGPPERLVQRADPLPGVGRGNDLAQDLLEHRVAVLADVLGPAASDGVAALLRRLVGLPATFCGDDARGAASVLPVI